MNLSGVLRRFLVRFPGLIRALNRHLPAPILQGLRSLAEKIKYSAVSEVHDLPPIFHYWSNRYVRPLLADFGYEDQQDFFVQHISSIDSNKPLRILSIGAGNCEADIDLVRQLLERGVNKLNYECLEINRQMLQRARTRADELGISASMTFTQADIEDWDPSTQAPYHSVVCRQFLHHVVDLETLMIKIRQAMAPGARFLVDDMVGRNGHMRWPEALAMVETLWEELPARYKYHHLHGVTNHRFVNWDCSITGFEGIRAQDILPLLIEHFHFETFIAFGNIIEVFVDRPYGPNFSVDDSDDLAFIDRVQALDQEAIEDGRIKPTHIVAAMTTEAVAAPRYQGHITPEFALRPRQEREAGQGKGLRSTG